MAPPAHCWSWRQWPGQPNTISQNKTQAAITAKPAQMSTVAHPSSAAKTAAHASRAVILPLPPIMPAIVPLPCRTQVSGEAAASLADD